MIWHEYARQLKEVLELDGSSVGVAYSDTPAGNCKSNRILPCAAFYQAARKGSTFNICAETSGCPGETTHLGLGVLTPERAALIKRFLIEGEKFRSCAAVFFRSRVLGQGQPPLGVGKYLVIGPLEEFELKPDLVLFLCNPEQASQLVTLATYETGIPLQAHRGANRGIYLNYPSFFPDNHQRSGSSRAWKIPKVETRPGLTESSTGHRKRYGI